SGADYLVIGRPIRDAVDPVATVTEIVNEMQAAFDARP
ncbi:MAG: orotidine-5'-phosphate decarboxylase, partial [Methylocystaceae bacterium]|nr:orotidine-5'-phosphate decarboxylase [Methylocystaceae bacterium]